MGAATTGEILPGLWRFEAEHPEWTEDEGGEDGWDRTVAWWAVASPQGLLLIDPLVTGWESLDALVQDRSGCAGILRTCHWHQRSVADAAARFGVPVSAKESTPVDRDRPPFDRPLRDGDDLLGIAQVFEVERADEVAVWLPAQSALLFGDAMIRRASGELRMCPASWTQPQGGPERLRTVLGRLTELPVEHVLVAHGPLVLGDGPASLEASLG